jgi:pyruvate dehydrogenase E2 component (dihydrolipoamide acetyltransferase)
MSQITMPQLSESMVEGTIVKWFAGDGDLVHIGDDLIEIETDKSTVSYESESEGILKIEAPEGSTCEVGAVIGQITPVASVRHSLDEDPDPESSEVDSHADIREESPTFALLEGSEPLNIAPDSLLRKEDSSVPPLNPRIDLTTPLARRSAVAYGVALDGIEGTGPRGRILRRDVLSAAGVKVDQLPHRDSTASQSPARQDQDNRYASSESQARGEKGDLTVTSLTRLQQTVARRMTEAKATIPHFQLECEVAMDDLLELRSQLKKTPSDHMRPSLNDLIIKACAIALRNHPLANGSYTEAGLEFHSRVNVGFAVAIGGGLIVPTVLDADAKSVTSIATTTQALAQQARSGSIAPADLSGATFTVSNLGMYGVTSMVPIINPPQAAILGVGTLRDSLALADGAVTSHRITTLTLSCDHRILYGSDAAEFLMEIRRLIEAPLSLLL